METYAYLATGLLAAGLIVSQLIAYTERREMLDRLMAKSLPEYKDNQTVEPNEINDTPDDTVPLEDAEDDLVNDYGQDEGR